MNNKRNSTFKKVSISTAIVTTALVGYGAVRAIDNDTSSIALYQRVPRSTATPSVAVEDATAEATTEAVTDSMYVDGEYTGDAIRAHRWGTMQVVAVIEGGELTEILIADYPHSTNLSNVLSRNGIPILISEAIEAQSVDIDVVSRATDTSEAFIQSLESALEDALIVAPVSDSVS